MNPIQWFPGHMAKTINQLKQEFQQADIIVECLDARIPLASRNPIIDSIISNKHHHIIALTKTDLADAEKTKTWIHHLKTIAPTVIELNILKNKGIKSLCETMNDISIKKRQKRRFYIAKVMICGIPNVGKSALINKLAKKKATQVQNKPGVTKQKQGVMINKFLELIDTPGILWPKLTEKDVGVKLALTKAIKQTIVDDYHLTEWLIAFLKEHYPDSLKKRYKLESLQFSVPDICSMIALNMNWLEKQNQLNENKLHRSIIEDFQRCRLGRVSLE